MGNKYTVLPIYKVSNTDPTELDIPETQYSLYINTDKNLAYIFYGKDKSGKPIWKNFSSNIKDINSALLYTPQIISPKNNETNFYGLIVSSEFQTNPNYKTKHLYSDWEIATDSEFKNIVEKSYNDDINLTTYLPNNLNPDSTYYVRVRYSDGKFVSNWSEPVKFTLASSFVVPPRISVLNYSVYPTLLFSKFKTVNLDASFAALEIEISDKQDFSTIIKTYEITNENTISLTINDDIFTPGNTYYIRARYKLSDGSYSSYGNTLKFICPKYKIDEKLPVTVEEGYNNKFMITHDNGKLFDLSKYTPVFFSSDLNCISFDLSSNAISINIPNGIESSKVVYVKLYYIDKDIGEIVSDIYEHKLYVYKIPVVEDDSIVITDFASITYESDGVDFTS